MKSMLVVLLSALVLPSALADSWASPQTRVITSPNGAWTATITPVITGKGIVKATLQGPDGEVEFDLRNTWSPVDVVLLDEGLLLTFDEWHSMGYGGNVAVAYQPDGTVLWHHSLADLMGKELEDAAPHSVSSIWWRKSNEGGLDWKTGEDGSSIVITLWDENMLAIQLDDGEAKRILVTDVGTDPVRLITRARADAMAGDDIKAIENFERAIQYDPDALDAYTELGQAYGRRGEHKKAEQILTTAAKRFGTRHDLTYNLANLWRQLAIAQEMGGNIKAAEGSLRKAVGIEPTYFTPVSGLAELLWKQKRSKDLTALLQEHYDRNEGKSYYETAAASDIASFWNDKGEHALAITWYEKLYSPNEVSDQFAYMKLAEAYEASGEHEKAIAIHKQLIVYWKAMGTSFDSYVASSKAAIERLEKASAP